MIEQMSSSGSSSSSDSASASGSGDDSSSDGEHDAPRPLSQTSPSRLPVANGGADRQQGNNQLMNTLREYLRFTLNLPRQRETMHESNITVMYGLELDLVVMCHLGM